jgi:phosphoribosylformylglycinamidine cyclo-ligase
LVKGIAHITGGGLYENMPRILPDDTAARFHHTQWECPPIFGIIQRRGDVATDEMFQVFNMGLGMVIVCGEEEVPSVRQNLPGSIVVGEIAYDPTNSVKVSIIP